MIDRLRRKLLQDMVHDRSEADTPSTIQSVSRKRTDHNYRKAAEFAAGRDVLDIGPGFGLGYDHLLEAGPRSITCMDHFGKAKDQFQVRDERIRFEVGDFLDHRFDEASFDTVLCIATVYYIPEIDRLLTEIARVLKPGGHLVINQFDRDLIRFFFGMELCELSPRYGKLQTAGEFRALLERYIGPVEEQLIQSPFNWRLRRLAAAAFPFKLAFSEPVLTPCPEGYKGVYNYYVAGRTA